MKKWHFIVCLILVLSFTACNQAPSKTEVSQTDNKTTENSATSESTKEVVETTKESVSEPAETAESIETTEELKSPDAETKEPEDMEIKEIDPDEAVSEFDRAVNLLLANEKVQARKGQVKNAVFYEAGRETIDGEEYLLVEMAEDFNDHISRLEMYSVNVKTEMIYIQDTLTGEWKKLE